MRAVHAPLVLLVSSQATLSFAKTALVVFVMTAAILVVKLTVVEATAYLLDQTEIVMNASSRLISSFFLAAAMCVKEWVTPLPYRVVVVVNQVQMAPAFILGTQRSFAIFALLKTCSPQNRAPQLLAVLA